MNEPNLNPVVQSATTAKAPEGRALQALREYGRASVLREVWTAARTAAFEASRGLQDAAISVPCFLTLLQRRDDHQGLTGLRSLPVVSQFGAMERSPFDYQRQGPAGQETRRQLKCIDPNDGFVLRVTRVEMRRLVVVPVHRNDDAEKAAKRWHTRDAPVVAWTGDPPACGP